MAVPHVEAVQKIVRNIAIEDGPVAFGLGTRDSASLWNPIPGLMSRLLEEDFAQ
jgi:hypothetical protein